MRLTVVMLLWMTGCARSLVPLRPFASVAADRPAPSPEHMANWVTIPRPDFAAWEAAAGWDDLWAVVPGTDGIAIVEQPLRPRPEPTQFELAVRPFRQRAPWQHVVSHRGLFLVGANHGEWGGKLRLYSRWGEELASLSNDVIVAVVDTGPDTAVSLHGINHLRVGEGEVAGWRWHDGAVAKAFSHALDGGGVRIHPARRRDFSHDAAGAVADLRHVGRPHACAGRRVAVPLERRARTERRGVACGTTLRASSGAGWNRFP